MKINKILIQFTICIILLIPGCKSGSSTQEDLGKALIECLKIKSVEKYLKLTRSKSDWKEIISKSNMNNSDKKEQKKYFMDNFEKTQNYLKKTFDKVLKNGELLGIDWSKIEYVNIKKVYESKTAGLIEEEYEVKFKYIDNYYTVTMLGCLELNRGWVMNVLYEKIKKAEALKKSDAKFGDKYPLHQAAYDGDLEKVKMLVENGADVNQQDDSGMTPLLNAVLFVPHKDVVEYLINNKADINIKDDKNSTALHYVITSGKLDIIKLLVENGVDINAENDESLKAIQIALLLQASNPDFKAVTEYLISKGAE